jgi:hypothetical protein
VGAAWVAALQTPWSHRRRLLAAAAVVLLAPGFALAAEYGNVSPLIVGLSLVGLQLATRRPGAGGARRAAAAAAGPLAARAGPRPVALLAYVLSTAPAAAGADAAPLSIASSPVAAGPPPSP